ncbi:hypothetical protein VOLCADRAFT_107185 [Volvox carteri f. nagariensis]|uniref:HECT-type E3 ubiquitin transferase n=1 Tax=Volvox carteri f. nagariensis TaxID=3068 RepID=D8UCH3_VOLCA|nr:uncharacterized protein VOLCADRAFT_107185 [Volvox carteri f. nagariensis]EFJ42551.1 hypothetical protein VOLCADRAFT_107185 [Volvox carteri f. nagariensis]|eukprot:XP_002956407.1 hypothetical protein VOLCADRAFT_107185 [Volvox carteri f. nagariensis]
MGCNTSKSVDSLTVPGGGVPYGWQRSDDSSKPWKKNQVVPAQQQIASGEGAASRQQRQQGKAAFVNVGKDTELPLDQGPTDVLDELKGLCSERVGGDKLASLAERLFEVLKQQLPGALRGLTSPKDLTGVIDVVKRIVQCCNSILQPVLVHINRVLSNRQSSTSWSELTSWEQVEFPDFLGVLEDACNAVYDLGVMEVGRPVVALIELIHELRRHYDAHKAPLEDSTCRVPALDELMGMLGIIFFRKVVLETPDSAQSKLDQYQQLREQIGWSDVQLATCTGPEARAMLLYLNQVSSSGEKRTNVTVRRSAAFWDAFEAFRGAGLPAEPMCYKYFPAFVDVYSQDGSGRGGSGRKPAVEAGEGHGPRKEFFSLAGQDMAGQAHQQQQQRSQLQQQLPDCPPGPVGADSNVPRRPALWVFNRTAGAYWYNTTLTESEELRDAYNFAGWLLGQSLLNRAPLGLPLPAVLFRAVLEGHGTDCGSGGGGFLPSLDMLSEFDPDAAAGVRNVASLPADQLRSMLELEGLPLDWSAELYTQHAVRRILRDDVAWQSEALASGFFAAVDRKLLRAWQLRPAALAVLVAGGTAAGGGAGGEPPADLSSLFRLALDDELSGNSAVLVDLLWAVLAEWSPERRLRFVEFVTGTSRLPLPGSELLKIQAPFVAMGAAEHKATLGMLPQAHTCDNLLELPNYWESLLAVRGVRGGPAAVARGTSQLTEGQVEELRGEVRRILENRLEMAVLNFQGYGLDERSGGRDDDDDNGAGNGDELGGKGLRGPEPSSEPDIPQLRPVALTADSLASLARFSAASSSVLHSSHPLAFSAAAASAPAPTGLRGSGGIGARASGTNVSKPGARGSGAASGLGLGTGVAGAGGCPTPPPWGKISMEFKTEEEERQASILARFDVDTVPGIRSGERALSGPPARPPLRQQSSTEESQDAFK